MVNMEETNNHEFSECDDAKEESQKEIPESSDLQAKIKELESNNNLMREEFDGQRAKMKELFLQKEEEGKRGREEYLAVLEEKCKLQNELDEVKSQLTIIDLKTQNDKLENKKAQEEIASLQQVINETVEESSTSRLQQDNELRKLRMNISSLEEENKSLRLQLLKDWSADEPQISLSTMTKSLAKKVTQLSAEALSLGPDNDENSSKGKRQAQDDAEELRSLVVPLEEQIKALKEKLRTTDDELQKCKEEKFQARRQQIKDAAEASEPVCDMCVNYETLLVGMQTAAKDLEKQLQESARLLQAQKQDLAKEVDFRKEMEEKWNEKKEEHKTKVAELTLATQSINKAFDELKQRYVHTQDVVTKEIDRLTADRETVQKHLHELQKQNEYLMGKYSKHSQQLQNENINMPNNVVDLHHSLLKVRQELILATIAREEAEKKEETLRSEVTLLHEQIVQNERTKESREAKLLNEIMSLKSSVEAFKVEQNTFVARGEKLEQIEKLLEETMKAKADTEAAKTKALTTVAELRQQVGNLQQDLNTGEQVQKDFVRLSQSLQIQLERIRETGSEVRWQHEEDVEECPMCHVAFTLAKKKEKIHCRHCGHIFCQTCLSNVVKSGPKQRPSRVCNVCHTLLVRETAPYFSQDPPHSPD